MLIRMRHSWSAAMVNSWSRWRCPSRTASATAPVWSAPTPDTSQWCLSIWNAGDVVSAADCWTPSPGDASTRLGDLLPLDTLEQCKGPTAKRGRGYSLTDDIKYLHDQEIVRYEIQIEGSF